MAATCVVEYCMPEADYVWLPRQDILQFEEIEALVDLFADLGVDKVRLTGGEPLLRRDLPDPCPARQDGASAPGDDHQRRARRAPRATLREAGLHRVTVSLDTLQRERFQRLARSTN
ncbi:MAG: radical SAM protein [Vicinamibacterales bacterium]